MSDPSTTFVRKHIWSLRPDDPVVTAYAAAVRAMKERDENDPRSWTYQAAMHGTHAAAHKTGWNNCQHESWFFLPWHRMFLYWFERIVRAEVIANKGPADWALPYWNYSLGGRDAGLPTAFRAEKLVDGSDNPLFEERATGMNSGHGVIGAGERSDEEALACPGFIGVAEFGGDRTAPAQFAHHAGVLEITPHGSVHDAVGNGGFPMSDVRRAAQDPIFWLHHANIDRIWSQWIRTQGGAGEAHSNPTDNKWLNQSFSFFDENGGTVSMTCNEVLESVAQLGYRYDDEQAPPTTPPVAAAATLDAIRAQQRDRTVSPPERQMIGALDADTVLSGHRVTVEVPIDEQAAEHFGAGTRAYLNVEEIHGERNPGTNYGIYANADTATPLEDQRAHYLGNLSFFGIEVAGSPLGDHAPHSKHASFEITSIARELEGRGEWAGHPLRVTFEPGGLELAPDAPSGAELVSPVHEQEPVTVKRLSVFYDA